MQVPYLKDSYWQPIEWQIRQFFFDAYFRELMAAVKAKPQELHNSQNDLIAALKSGRINFDGKYYRGKLNNKITNELKKFAVWDRSAQAYRGTLPSWLTPTIMAIASEKQRMIAAVSYIVDGLDIEGIIYDAVDRLSIAEMTRKIDGDLMATVRNLGIDKDDIDAELIRGRVNENIRDNLQRDIVGWNKEQIQQLRDMTQRAIQNGYNRREMEQVIIDEWGVSESKAKFLARQEASLFFSEERRTLFEDAGIRYYEWRANDDTRVRPEHKALDTRESKTIYIFGQPPETDQKTHRHNEPGEDWNCRCVAIPLTDRQAQQMLDRGYEVYRG